MMIVVLSSLVHRLNSLFVSPFCSPLSFTFNYLLDYLIKCLTIIIPLMKFSGDCIEILYGTITGHHYSFVNAVDNDFNIGITAYDMFKINYQDQDYDNADLYDLFHVYLSKITYETPEKIINQLECWGFNRNSINILSYNKNDLRYFCCRTLAVAIYYGKRDRIIIGFRGTQPTDLIQWLTDISINLLPIQHTSNDENKQIKVHAGFYAALGLHETNIFKTFNQDEIMSDAPMFLQILHFIQKHNQNNKCKISLTGHSLGGALASLFSYVLLARGYGSSISGVYTYGQPLVGNYNYAEIINNRLGNRFHRWINHNDIVARIPVIALPSITVHYIATPYSEALETTMNNIEEKSNAYCRYFYHSGLRFKIDREGNLERTADEEPTLAYRDEFNVFNVIYCTKNAIYSFLNITPTRSILWLIFPTQINDHMPGDYARKIKRIIQNRNK